MESNFLRKFTNKSDVVRFWHKHLQKIDGLSEFVMLWIDFSENKFDSY